MVTAKSTEDNFFQLPASQSEKEMDQVEASTPSRRRLQLSAGLLLLGALLTYFNSFPGVFHFDDFPLMLENPQVRENFRYTSFLDQYGGRPLTMWTFHWNYRLFGEEPLTYHLFNFLLHCAAVVLIFVLLLKLFSSHFLAFAAALIFAVHPLQTQAVNYIWARSVLLMVCLGLVALLLVRQRPWVALCFFQLAVWSRAEGLVFLLPLLLRDPRHWKRFVVLALFNAAGLVYFLLHHVPQEVAWRHSAPGDYWTSQLVAFWKYTGLMFWPASLNLDYHFPVPGLWPVTLSASALAALCLLFLPLKRKAPALALGIAWAVVSLLPSSLVPNLDSFNESRAYPAVAGFALVTAWMLWRLPFRGAILASLAAVFMLTAAARNEVWRDDLALWQDAAGKSPRKARVRYNLGTALVRKAALEEAEREFEAARNLNPQDDLSYAALGYCAEKRQDWEEARRLYQEALQLNPHNAYARSGVRRLNEIH